MAAFSAFVVSSLRLCSLTAPHIVHRVTAPFSVCAASNGGQNWRTNNGMARDGLAYGPLTDNPDWSYVDGTAAPETKRQKMRRNRRQQEGERIAQYLQEMNDGTQEENPYPGIAKR